MEITNRPWYTKEERYYGSEVINLYFRSDIYCREDMENLEKEVEKRYSVELNSTSYTPEAFTDDNGVVWGINTLIEVE